MRELLLKDGGTIILAFPMLVLLFVLLVFMGLSLYRCLKSEDQKDKWAIIGLLMFFASWFASECVSFYIDYLR